jgi:hypothetical protein
MSSEMTTRRRVPTREQWIATTKTKLIDARQRLSGLLMDAKHLDDDEVNAACREIDQASEAIGEALKTIGWRDPLDE